MGVDLSLLESLTRELLEVEARRRGIKSPEFRTRGELVRLILRHQYGGQLEVSREALSRSIQTVRFVRAIVGSALSALPELGVLGKLRGEGEPAQPEGFAPEPTWERPRAAAAPEPVPEFERAPTEERPAVRAEKAPPTLATPNTAGGSGTEASVGAASGDPHAPSSDSVESTDSAERAELERAPTRVPDEPVIARPAAAAREAVTRTFELEPIRTRSMARLLAAQGHKERALAIYEELLARGATEPGSEPGSERELADELNALRQGAPVPHPELPKPKDRSSVELPEQRERFLCEGEPEKGLTLRWDISDEGCARARAVLGAGEGEAELTLRLVAIRPDPDPVKVVRSEITEHGPVSAAGEWSLGPLRQAARCIAAIGLRAGDRFVSIAHALPTG
jgi:hypothetical protein